MDACSSGMAKEMQGYFSERVQLPWREAPSNSATSPVASRYAPLEPEEAGTRTRGSTSADHEAP